MNKWLKPNEVKKSGLYLEASALHTRASWKLVAIVELVGELRVTEAVGSRGLSDYLRLADVPDTLRYTSVPNADW